MLEKLSPLERWLLLGALILATLVVAVLLASTLSQYIASIQPTPTLRSLPAIWTATPPAATPTLHPSSTPLN